MKINKRSTFNTEKFLLSIEGERFGITELFNRVKRFDRRITARKFYGTDKGKGLYATLRSRMCLDFESSKIGYIRGKNLKEQAENFVKKCPTGQRDYLYIAAMELVRSHVILRNRKILIQKINGLLRDLSSIC